MTPERWQKIKEIFNSATKYRPEERGVFLSQACAGDRHLRSEVESLIASHEKTGSFIDAPAYEATAHLIVDERSGLKPGQAVGSYEIKSLISRGGKAEFSIAHDNRLNRKREPKILTPASL